MKLPIRYEHIPYQGGDFYDADGNFVAINELLAVVNAQRPEGGAQESGMVALAGALTKARIEVESDRQDAERYRWWRERWTSKDEGIFDELNEVLTDASSPAAVDKSIDEAMSESPMNSLPLKDKP